MEHTKTPWKASSKLRCQSPYDDHVQIDHPESPNANGCLIIARCYGRAMQANAAFICKAVNCHDSLVGALSNLVDSIVYDAAISIEKDIEKAKTMIAKAQ